MKRRDPRFGIFPIDDDEQLGAKMPRARGHTLAGAQDFVPPGPAVLPKDRELRGRWWLVPRSQLVTKRPVWIGQDSPMVTRLRALARKHEPP